MTVAVQVAALGCVAAGILSGVLALIAGRDLRAALRVALDLWLAAGLLRLALPSNATDLAAAAAIIAVRQLVGLALRRSSGPNTRPDGGNRAYRAD